jgi:hypothetical protein
MLYVLRDECLNVDQVADRIDDMGVIMKLGTVNSALVNLVHKGELIREKVYPMPEEDQQQAGLYLIQESRKPKLQDEGVYWYGIADSPKEKKEGI